MSDTTTLVQKNIERVLVSTEQAPSPGGPYSQGIRCGNLLFAAGQGPFNSETQLVTRTFAEQVHQTFDNLQAVAEAAGSGLEHMVRLGVYLSDLDYFAEFNRIAAERLTAPYPVRTTIPVALRAFDVEMDAVFVIPEVPAAQ